MQELFIYLLKSSGLIATFFLAYHFLLRKDTFFNSNRWFLLSGLITSLLLPLFFITKKIFVESRNIALQSLNNISNEPILSKANQSTYENIDWFQISIYGYAIVVLILLSQFCINVFSLMKLLKNQPIQKQQNLSYINLNQNVAPFSFFNYIVFNSNLYSEKELENILLHEEIHSKEKHSLDVLVVQLFTIVFWFNPFVWLYKKAMIQNLEYIADSKAIQHIKDKKRYQLALLKVVTHQNYIPITNHFYQSLIKKRIVMLNKNQSNKKNIWKYAVVIPTLIAFVFLFQVKVIAQEKENTKNTSLINKITLEWTKNSTNEEIDKEINFVKNTGVSITYSEIKRNSNNEITTIKLKVYDKKGNIKVINIENEKPIKPINIEINIDKDGQGTFNFTSEMEKKELIESNNSNSDIEKTNDLKEFWSFDSCKENGKDYLIFIDGVKQKKNSVIKIAMDREIDKTEKITNPELLKKYGEDGKNGVFLVTTKKSSEVMHGKTLEEEETTNTKFEKGNSNINSEVFQLDSNDPDAGWYSLTDIFKEKNITTTVSNIKRNENNKIIAINIVMKSKDGRVQKLDIERTTPIKSIEFFVGPSKDKKWNFGVRELEE